MLAFDWKESSLFNYGNDHLAVLETVTNRYIGANPALPFVLRPFSQNGIMQDADGHYLLTFDRKFADAANGSYCYAYGLVWSDEERSIQAELMPFSPIQLLHNGEMIYRSSVVEEMDPNGRASIPLLLTKGWNTLLIETKKTAAGFGCYFGAEEAKVRILQICAPFSKRAGHGGWVYSKPVDSSMLEHAQQLKPDSEEESSPLQWLPTINWTHDQQQQANLARIFGFDTNDSNKAAIARTTISSHGLSNKLELSLTAYGETYIWLNGALLCHEQQPGTYHITAQLDSSIVNHQLLVWSASSTDNWGFEVSCTIDDKPAKLYNPLPIVNYDEPWIYLGPFSSACKLTDTTFEPSSLLTFDHTAYYWQLDAPNVLVRPYYENSMLSNKWTVGTMSNFGRWDYPLGVTMYGLFRTASILQRPDIRQYALLHIEACTNWYRYSMWDYNQYGFPAINHQLVLIKMLDNCGSFGSAMLEAYALTKDERMAEIAHRIAHFMLNELERQEDGAFYRTCEGEYSANTMWADDLYMSTPFLIRYSELFKHDEALNIAATQFSLYRNYLFIDRDQIMSHVYDFKYNKATLIPWGRGNGWVLFSLTELLQRLPAEHPRYDELIDFYNSFANGIFRLQDETGLWHQVLNEADSYLEASCTAMFIYGLSRGLRYGWLQNSQYEQAIQAVRNAWNGLTRYCIDRQGHVHLVCSGSRYSFASDYYKYDLRTVTNDNHGIGIMMLAAVEYELLDQALSAHTQTRPIEQEVSS